MPVALATLRKGEAAEAKVAIPKSMRLMPKTIPITCFMTFPPFLFFKGNQELPVAIPIS
jgi:hypothetical protein